MKTKSKNASSKRVIDNVTLVDIDALTVNERNARLHPETQIKALCASITEFGFTIPILATKHLEVLAGHGRLIAAKRLEMKKVPTLIFQTELTPEQVQKYALLDNQLGLISRWDIDKLNSLFADMPTLSSGQVLKDLFEHTAKISLTPATGVYDDGNQKSKYPYSQAAGEVSYEPGNAPIPQLSTLASHLASDFARKAIHGSDAYAQLPQEVKFVLDAAVARLTVFNFRACADYYSNAPAEVQRLFELAVLVVVDTEPGLQTCIDAAVNEVKRNLKPLDEV
jgi:hypothetical protein